MSSSGRHAGFVIDDAWGKASSISPARHGRRNDESLESERDWGVEGVTAAVEGEGELETCGVKHQPGGACG